MVNPCVRLLYIVVVSIINSFYWYNVRDEIASGICDFQIINKYESFYPLEDVGSGTETQEQVGGNVDYLG